MGYSLIKTKWCAETLFGARWSELGRYRDRQGVILLKKFRRCRQPIPPVHLDILNLSRVGRTYQPPLPTHPLKGPSNRGLFVCLNFSYVIFCLSAVNNESLFIRLS